MWSLAVLLLLVDVIRSAKQPTNGHYTMSKHAPVINPGFQCVAEWVADSREDFTASNYLLKHAKSTFASISAIKKSIRRGQIAVNNAVIDSQYLIREGDIIRYFVRAESNWNRGNGISKVADDLDDGNFAIVYEDEALAVIRKPQGAPLFSSEATQKSNQTSMSESEGGVSSVNSYILENLAPPPSGRDIQPLRRPQLVHRLDRGTGGLMLIAKTRPALTKLSDAFASRGITKRYRAIVVGELPGDAGMVDRDLGGKIALSEWERHSVTPSHIYGSISTVDVFPKTGRYHQIRRHMDSIGHPILGDRDYWFSQWNSFRHETVGHPPSASFECDICLWALGLQFSHPISGKDMNFDIDEPSSFTKVRLFHQQQQP